MAHCKISSQDFIQNAFAPVIAVKCSELVNQACRKNNLSFIELLQPFSKLNTEAQMRDSAGNVNTIKNLRMNFLNVNDAPPQPIVARQFLNSSVIISSNIRISTININDCSLQIPSSIPWFEVWRETFLRVQHPSDHEFTKHFLACMFVVSSAEPNPLNVLSQMLEEVTQSEHITQSQLPKWFNTNVLRYIVVLHDTMEGKKDTAIQLIETLKQQHGNHNCFLLQINSRSPGTVDDNFLPDPWSQFLIKKTESLELIDSDNPRNLIDTSGVTSMPTNVVHDSVDLESDCIASTTNIIGEKLEIGQEVNEINTFTSDFHPLTPDTENLEIVEKVEENALSVLNPNDWPSNATTPTVPHGACLTTNDVEQLKMLVNEFCLRSLLPYIEKQIQQLSDVISHKKGVSRSLFSATKRWFTPNKLGASGSVMQISTVTYTNDSPEMQLRKLGDLYFMFGNYSMAFQIYHSAKRDFNADQAWLYYAGALEMAALSAFMCGEMSRKTCDYMEESITTYLYTCKLPQFATRATLLSTECLKDKGQYGEAAHQFIRMTSEDSDLGSALLLEQAAYCFLFCNKPNMVRKYAFHTVLSGHRFSKSIQRKHALRCYRQAFQIFKNKGWSLAEDHIYYTIGRQALFVKELEEAKDAFSKLLSPKSRQNAQQQAIFLKEYLNSFNVLMQSKSVDDKTFPILSLFTLKGNDTKVLIGPQPALKVPGRTSASAVTFTSDEDDEITGKWNKLEQILVQEAFGSFGPESMIFKPLNSLFSNKNSGSSQPVAIMSEPIQVLVTVHNTLQIMLPLKDIYLLWEFTEKGETKSFNNECSEERELCKHIRTHKLDSFTLAANIEDKLVLSITPLAVGQISITGICYTVINTQDSTTTVTGKQEFNIHGPKLVTRDKENRETCSEDNRLNIIIAPSASCLQVSFNELNQELLCNELQNISIEFRNCGNVPLHKIMMASSTPHLFSTTFPINESETDEANFENSKIKENKKHIVPFSLPSQFKGKLEPGQSYIVNLWFRAPSIQGSSSVDLLFYYENLKSESIPRYRLVKHNWHLSVQSSLITSLSTRKSKDSCNEDTLTFSVKATNCNQIHHAAVSEITLVQAALVSPNWKLHKNVIISNDVKLQTQESVHFLLKATKDKKSISGAHYTDLMLSMHLEVYPEIKQPSINFANRILQNANSNTANGKTIDSILILGWNALVIDSAGNKRNVIGQDFILVDKSLHLETPKTPTNLFVSRNDPASTRSVDNCTLSTLQQKITYNLAHSPLLVHNFKDTKICTVPMQLMLHSNADTSLIIKVNTISSNGDSTPMVLGTEIFTTNSSNNFRSIGRSEFQCILEPSSSFQVRMTMAVTAPGTYELGDRIRIFCRTSSNKNYSNFLVCKVQSVLIVKSANCKNN